MSVSVMTVTELDPYSMRADLAADAEGDRVSLIDRPAQDVVALRDPTNGASSPKARDPDYKLADFGGLYLFVSTRGHRSWRLKYRLGGKERRLH